MKIEKNSFISFKNVNPVIFPINFISFHKTDKNKRSQEKVTHKKMFSKVGLTNKSVDPSRQRLCTLNTILQFLFNIPLFRETILQKVVPPSSSSRSEEH